MRGMGESMCSRWCVFCVGQFGGDLRGVSAQQMVCVLCGTVWGRECAAGDVCCVWDSLGGVRSRRVLCVGQFGGNLGGVSVHQVVCVVCGTVWGSQCAAGGVCVLCGTVWGGFEGSECAAGGFVTCVFVGVCVSALCDCE